jgi:hypothetical protein
VDPDHLGERQQTFGWINATHLRNLNFPPANQAVLNLLVERACKPSAD